jgi:hypothetical protein
MNLYQKLLKISEKVKYIKRDEKHSGINFRPLSRQSVVKVVRQELIDQGVCIVPGKVQNLIITPFKTTKGAEMLLTTIAQEYIIFNADKPEENFVCSIPGSGGDNQDKGSGKAFTYTEKQLFINLFHIETGDEDAPEEVEESEKLSVEQVATLRELAKRGDVSESIVAHVAGVERLEDIAADYFEKLKTRLENKLNQTKVKPVKEN